MTPVDLNLSKTANLPENIYNMVLMEKRLHLQLKQWLIREYLLQKL